MNLDFPCFETFKQFAQNNAASNDDNLTIQNVLGIGNMFVRKVSNDEINTFGMIVQNGDGTICETIRPSYGTIVLFSKNNDWLSKLTRYATKSIFTHVGILLSSGDVFYEALPSEIYAYKIAGLTQLLKDRDDDPCLLLVPNKKIDINIPTTAPTYEKNILSFAKLIIPYGIRKHFKTLTPHTQFCSEFIMNMLPFKDVNAENVSPGDFFRKSGCEGDTEIFFKYIQPNYTPYFIIRNEKVGMQTFKIW